MKNKQNKRITVLLAILVGLLVVAYKVLFVSDTADLSLGEDVAASVAVEQMLNQVNNINFDTSIIKDPKINTLKSIETPLPSIPVGKTNPFSGL